VESRRVTLEKYNCTLQISPSIAEIKDDWRVLSHRNIYADPDYLSLLERKGPLGYKYVYAIIYFEDKPVAALYFQMKRIELAKDFRLHTHSNNFLKKINLAFTKQLFKLINQNLLIFGNVLLTGEYAFGTKSEFELTNHLLNHVFSHVKSYFKEEYSLPIKAILCKDFYREGVHKEISFSVPGFYEFKVQPDMIMALDPQWKQFDDFLKAVKSKYRVKYKKVMRQAESLDYREMDLEMLEQYNDEMYALYEATAKRATFSLFYLHPKYFIGLKECFFDKIRITGIFRDGKILGFYTYVINGEYGDAHFIGYDVERNSDYQIYFNILLGLIKKAIDTKVKFLNLSRTALEIKSSVGAEPHDMFIYLRHENGFINRIMPMILDRVVPKLDWTQRSPFK